jgi:putative tryptophan/tyrosine transport system substrate-binding protein
MRRREFISAIAGATAWPLAVRAQPPAMPVIGYLTEVPNVAHLNAAFRRGMAELGYVEGKNFAADYRFNPASLSQAATDLVRRSVNAIFAAAPAAVAAVSKATTSIPVVGIDLESDPVAKGYVTSLARPGGNITGMFLDIPELSGKQLVLLKEIVPRLSRIAIFGVPDLNALQFVATETAARAVGVETEILEVRVPNDLRSAMEAARARQVEAGILLSSPLVFTSSTLIGELALAKRLPLISLFGEFAKNGGLIAYGPNVSEMFRRCGEYVGKVLHGAKPSELPIQRPERFDLVINLKSAKALGLEVPTQLQQLADEVIE